MKISILLITQIVLLGFFSITDSKEEVKEMILTSGNFNHQGAIPARHTGDGADVSPALSWAGVPAGTKSLVLIVDDPDAPDPAKPRTTWVHWVLYNIPPATGALAEGIRGLPAGTLEGKNDFGQTGYRGPTPPVGRHRYFFKLYALDTVLPDLFTPTKARVEKAMEGHILLKAELVGLYQRK